MVKVNCGALPSSLAESELFGHERGAFTGAVQQKKGRFELAHHGTIFLDEVGELSADVQVKLLRVLQEQELERLGGTRTTKVNVRVIAATNRDLEEEVRARPLPGRPRSIASTSFRSRCRRCASGRRTCRCSPTHFATEFAPPDGQDVRGIDAEAHGAAHDLRVAGQCPRAGERARARGHPVRGLSILEEHLGVLGRERRDTGAFPTLEEMERQHILRALAQTGGVLAGPQGAARLLGMSRSTVWSRMKKLGIQAHE